MDHYILPAADIRILCRPDSLVPALLEALGDGAGHAAWGTIEAEPPERSGGDALDEPDFERGAEIQKILDSCYESSETGSWVEL